MTGATGQVAVGAVTAGTTEGNVAEQVSTAGDTLFSLLKMDLEQTMRPLVSLFSGNDWLQGIAVILVTLAATSLITWLLFSMVCAVTRRTRMELDDHIARLLRPPVHYSLLMGGITYGLSLMPLGDALEHLLQRGVKSLGVVIWIVFFSRLAALLLERLVALSDRYSFVQRRTLTLFSNVAKVVILAVGVHAIFVIWDIDMTAWLASAGIVGVAVGFAAKDTLSNLFAGVFILADAPYKVGDYIVMSSGDRGKVTHIGLRSTRILTRDDVEITIPNSIIANTTIVNQSGGPSEKLRVRIKVGVAYGSDIDEVRGLLLDVALKEPLVCSHPEPRVRFRLFGASSLDFELLCWIVRPELRGRAVDEMNTTIYKLFREHDIEIPYTKQDLYIRELPSGKR